MYNLIIIFMFIFSFVCSNGDTKKINEPQKENNPGGNSKQTVNLGDRQAIIPATEKMEWAFGRNYKTFTPTAEDIQSAEEILSACYNKEVTGTVNPFLGRKLEDYYRQYVGGVKENGEKIIYINCFCYIMDLYVDQWKTELIMVDDGGNCYFNVKANLNKNNYYELMVNGLP